MAKAPRPGVGKRAEEAKNAKVIHKLRVKDETRTVALANIPVMLRFQIRKITGDRSLEDLMASSSFGIDTLMVIWWLAGRMAGGDLPVDRMDEDWPEDVGADDIEFFEVTPDDGDGDDPQL